MQNILLLHGALGFSEDLTPLSQALKSTDLTVHAFSFSGHSKTPFQLAFGIEQFAEELRSFILQKELKNVFVFGYSMGGFVAFYLALKEKDLISKIITLGTKFNWSKESVAKETRMLNPEMMFEKVPAFAKSLETKHGNNWKELVLKTASLMKEIEEKDLLNTDDLKTIGIPVLLGLADKDQMVTLDETVHVFKTLSNATMFMLPGAKHQIETVNVDLLSKLIVDFIQ